MMVVSEMNLMGPDRSHPDARGDSGKFVEVQARFPGKVRASEELQSCRSNMWDKICRMAEKAEISEFDTTAPAL
jgi:hypothetical protein